MPPKHQGIKPKHQAGYTAEHARLCERTLVTLLRGLGPWKKGIYVVGGLAPRYLITQSGATASSSPHAGTTDVDIVLDFAVLTSIEAYRTLEQNLKGLGFTRGSNDEGHVQHHSWRRQITEIITVVVDLLCDADAEDNARIAPVPGERRLSALGIPGAHEDRGVVTELVRIAGIVSFIVLKALALEDRLEEKDAYDLVYCLKYFEDGPTSVADKFAAAMHSFPDEPLIPQAVEILRRHFASDSGTPGIRKDGPVQYARFFTDPGRPDQDARNRRDAVGTMEVFLDHLTLILAI